MGGTVTEPVSRPVVAASIAEEVQRRRTFAIISHPDAGKTTLTEKLLLYGGAVNLAGSVTARKAQRKTASDWMALERERGISVTSTVLTFPYRGCHINLLDTPGHEDFSEDTFRTLTAVDSAVMVLDAARGIESQTLKLFDVCRRRRTPIFTFINKLDRPGRHPLELLDEIERVLGLQTCPINWPIGDGVDFRGLYDLRGRAVHLFERTEHGATRAPVVMVSLDDESLAALVGEAAAHRLREEVALVEAMSPPFDQNAIDAGEMTPVAFGSALTNFGVQLFLDAFVEHAPRPQPRKTTTGVCAPDDPRFSAFVFKIQANMDPRHRDRVAFLRVCSGVFRRDMEVWHPRLRRRVRLSPPLRLFGQDREVVEEAVAGDVVGVINPGVFAIGDTVSEGDLGLFEPMPRFQPEHFAAIHATQSDRYKQFLKGLAQIEEEGGIQLFYPVSSGRREPILAAVGALQFDVVQYRLEAEYGVTTRREPLAYTAVRWVSGDPRAIAEVANGRGRLRAEDRLGRPVILFTTEWDLRYAIEHAAAVTFADMAAD
ncbi:MAG: peptide chain release factor 3 [Thermomicrobiales bacterium]|nr:MAG: peptide chain release factor 3 [Thermomicrobiales bacterium]